MTLQFAQMHLVMVALIGVLVATLPVSNIMRGERKMKRQDKMKEKQVCRQVTIVDQKASNERKFTQDLHTGNLHTYHFVYYTYDNWLKWIDIKAINYSQAVRQWLMFKVTANIRLLVNYWQVD